MAIDQSINQSKYIDFRTTRLTPSETLPSWDRSLPDDRPPTTKSTVVASVSSAVRSDAALLAAVTRPSMTQSLSVCVMDLASDRVSWQSRLCRRRQHTSREPRRPVTVHSVRRRSVSCSGARANETTPDVLVAGEGVSLCRMGPPGRVGRKRNTRTGGRRWSSLRYVVVVRSPSGVGRRGKMTTEPLTDDRVTHQVRSTAYRPIRIACPPKLDRSGIVITTGIYLLRRVPTAVSVTARNAAAAVDLPFFNTA